MRAFLLDAAFGGSEPSAEATVPTPSTGGPHPTPPGAVVETAPTDDAQSIQSASTPFPLKIYTRRSGIRADALMLNRAGRITLLDSNGKAQPEIFESPSPAAVKVLDVKAANGWAEWYYDDPETGQPRQISGLRPPGMRQVRRRR